MKPMHREGLLQKLRDFDEEVNLMFGDTLTLRVVIVGGGALVLMDVIPRMTHDIDVLGAMSADIADIMQSYDINGRVNAYSQNFPYNYEDRLVPVRDIQGKSTSFYTAALEDIVISKLCSNRDTDYADITSPHVLEMIDWTLLDHLATAEDEIKSSCLNDQRYREFLFAYQEYERKYRPCGN